MILKKRKKPLPLVKLEAVIPRLSPQHPHLDEMKQDAAKRYRGYIGEQKVDYFLEQLPNQSIHLQDVQLRIDKRNFYIDILIITAHSIYCIEIKNFRGTITFDTILQQFTRQNGSEETGYRHPLTQVQTHAQLLSNWLAHHKYHLIPINYFVAISDPSTVVKVIGDQEKIARSVAHAQYLPQKIMDNEEKLRTGRNKIINYQSIAQTILHNCRENDNDILAKYNITKNMLRTGVPCPGCGYLGLERKHGKWECPKCKDSSIHAHKKAIHEYMLLSNKRWITNKECRQFLHIHSRATATRLMKKSGLIYETKKRRWIKNS